MKFHLGLVKFFAVIIHFENTIQQYSEAEDKWVRQKLKMIYVASGGLDLILCEKCSINFSLASVVHRQIKSSLLHLTAKKIKLADFQQLVTMFTRNNN